MDFAFWFDANIAKYSAVIKYFHAILHAICNGFLLSALHRA